MNDEIDAKKIRLITQDGDNKGVVPLKEGLRIADQNDLDLVEVAPDANPPVCRMLNYEKYRYEREKQRKKQKKHQKQTKVKELRFRITTEEHDLKTKLKQAERFLDDGNIVRVSVFFKGREVVYKDQGREKLNNFAEELEEKAEKRDEIQDEGFRLMMDLEPK